MFEGVEPDPSIETVMAGAKVMQEYQSDVIVSIGGGSPIDAAKAMWVFYEHPELTFEDIKKPFSMPKLRKKAIFVAFICCYFVQYGVFLLPHRFPVLGNRLPGKHACDSSVPGRKVQLSRDTLMKINFMRVFCINPIVVLVCIFIAPLTTRVNGAIM